MKSAYGNTILIGITIALFFVAHLSYSVVFADTAAKEKIVAPTLPTDSGKVHKISVVLSPDTVSAKEKHTTEEVYSHPETGENVSREEMVSYLQEKISDVKERIEDHIAAVEVEDIDSEPVTILTTPIAGGMTRKSVSSRAPSLHYFGDKQMSSSKMRYIHPETGKDICPEEMIIYLKEKIGKMKERIDIISQQSLSADQPDIKNEVRDEVEKKDSEIVFKGDLPTATPVVKKTTPAKVEVDVVDTEGKQGEESEEIVTPEVTDKEADKEQDTFSNSLMMLLLVIAFLILIAFAPSVVQYFKKRKEGNRDF